MACSLSVALALGAERVLVHAHHHEEEPLRSASSSFGSEAWYSMVWQTVHALHQEQGVTPSTETGARMLFMAREEARDAEALRTYLKNVRTSPPVDDSETAAPVQPVRHREPSTAPRATRKGVVRLEGRAFADDGGKYLAVGASLFWALWGYQHDRPKLDKHLDYLASRGVDYIRVFGVVGPPWNDRLVDPRGPDWDRDLAGMLDLAYSRGLRTELTIWQDTGHTPTAADRTALVDRIAAVVASRPQTIQYFEIANEGYGTDRFPSGWPDEAQTLATRLREKTPHLVAVTSPGTLEPADIATWYGRSKANLLTAHLPREVIGGGLSGEWRYVRQTWDPWLASGLAWTNDEGKGPQSSVAEDSDPVRLTMYAGLTWLCGGAGFVLHTGAGVSGAGERGRVKNIWDVPNIERTLAGIAATRKLLPPDLPNWSRHNTNSRFPDYPFDTRPITPMVEGGQLVRAFAATSDDGRIVAMPVAASAPVPFNPRFPMHVDVHDPMTGDRLESHDGPFTLSPRPAAVVIGQRH
jgi:hypothetical protein